MNLGEKIRYFRKVKNLSQQELAAGICSIPYLSKIENGVTEPSAEIQHHLATRLDINLDSVNESQIIRHYVDLFHSLYQKDYKSAEQKFQALTESPSQSVDEDILNKIFKSIYLMMTSQGTKEAHTLLNEVAHIDNVIKGEKAFYYLLAKAQLNYFSNNFEDALHYFFRTENQLEENRFQEWEIGYLLYMIGLSANQLYKNIIAFEYTQKALTIFEKNYFFERCAYCRIILAIIHLRIRNFEESTKQLLLAETIADTFNDDVLRGIIYHNLGRVAAHKGESENAVELLTRSLKAKEKEPLSAKIMTILALVREYEKINQRKTGLELIETWIEQVQTDPLCRDFELHLIYYKQLFAYDEHNKKVIQFMIKELIPNLVLKNEWFYLSTYYPIIGKYFEDNQKYKQASMYYSLTLEAMKKLHEMGVTYESKL
ncbi:helix-turn-helix domain-containing protein [Fictibacillus barbaricus]|uniref:Transcriptional regulator with XRE-family HTH domain n=1 Tax=Fictibacillus barbaricus TaxID=182136 RepID=A0ABU1U1H4_9BACL|nr:helix-turn-helix transcriptional regulator [Fictibacillus barbaricus]MDR7073273.1 transcriptional regulator with XRE-family HTH domain [Fictibacillus barbaricus]